MQLLLVEERAAGVLDRSSRLHATEEQVGPAAAAVLVGAGPAPEKNVLGSDSCSDVQLPLVPARAPILRMGAAPLWLPLHLVASVKVLLLQEAVQVVPH